MVTETDDGVELGVVEGSEQLLSVGAAGLFVMVFSRIM